MALKATLSIELRKTLVKIKLALLAGLYYADDIIKFLKDHLTDLQPYFPDNIYRFMGGSVVVGSLLIGFYMTHKSTKAQAVEQAPAADEGGQ